MRILMWLTVGFGIACGLFGFWGVTGGWWAVLTLAALLGLGGRKRRSLRRPALMALGLALGLLWTGIFAETRLAEPRALDGKTCTAVIRITDFSYETDYSMAADGLLGDAPVRVYLEAGEPLLPGQELRGIFRFRLTTPEGADTYHDGKGIFLLAYQEGEVRRSGPTLIGWRQRIANLRHGILETMDRFLPEDVSPFGKALLLGYTADLSYAADTAFKVSGIRHVVAVSGLHVSILFALLSTLTLRKRFLTALAGFPMLLLFAALAGFTPSVSRACIMAGLMLLAMLLDKEYDGPTALSFAALAMLAGNPLVITDIGFQLSVASVAGIYLFYEKIHSWLTGRLQPKAQRKHWTVRWISTSVSVSLSALVLTAPLCAWHFGTVSLVGVLTNLLTLWLISGIFYGLMGVCLLGLVWQGGAILLGKLLAVPARYILFTAKTLSKFPLAAVYTVSPYITAWLVFVYILLGFFLFSKQKRPGILGACTAMGLCVALAASYAEPMLDSARLTVLDVGQGQCIVYESGGRAVLVDCGGEYAADRAAEMLLSHGGARLDAIILTHLDADHAGGVQDLLTRIPADLLILPPMAGGPAHEGTTLYASEDLEIAFGDTVMTVYPAQYPGIGNENSLCILFDSEKCDILITGDREGFGERSLLRHTALPRVDVLIAGHHGAEDAACRELLEAVRPEIVCISVGEKNIYGHPAPALIERLREFGCQIYRTDRQGTIIIRR